MDVHHTAIAGARMRVLGRADAGIASADASGRCALELKPDSQLGSDPAGTWTELEISAAGFATTMFGLRVKREPAVQLGEIVLTTAGAIQGRVVDEAGQAIAGADVLVQLHGSPMNMRASRSSWAPGS